MMGFFLLANTITTLFSRTNASEIPEDQLFATFHLKGFLYVGKVILKLLAMIQFRDSGKYLCK